MTSKSNLSGLSLLDTLEQRAQERFPGAFDAINDPSLYSFSRLGVEGETEDLDMLCIGKVCPTSSPSINVLKPLYAHPRGRSVRYYYMQSEGMPLIQFDGDMFPDVGRTRYRHGDVDPFRHLVPTPTHAGSVKDKLEDRRNKTTGVAFLVMFAFLLTGRIDFVSESPTEVLRQLEKVCATIEQNKTKKKGSALSIIDVEDGETETSTARLRHQPSTSFLSPSVPLSPKARSRSKRVAGMRESESEAGLEGPTKRARCGGHNQSFLEGVGIGWLNDSDSPELIEKLQTQTQDIMDTILSICKVRAEREVARDLGTLKTELKSLKEQLVKSQNHTKDLLEKHEELKAESRGEVEQLEAQLVKEQIKTLKETDKYNEQRKEYRKLQDKFKAREAAGNTDNRI